MFCRFYSFPYFCIGISFIEKLTLFWIVGEQINYGTCAATHRIRD